MTERASDNGGGGTPPENPDPERLIAWMREQRPDWTERDIRAALDDPAITRHPWPAIRQAAELVTTDPSTRWPSRLAKPGPWWDLPRDKRCPPEPPPAGEQVADWSRFDPNGTNAQGRALMRAAWQARQPTPDDPDDQADQHATREAS